MQFGLKIREYNFEWFLKSSIKIILDKYLLQYGKRSKTYELIINFISIIEKL